MLETLAGWRLFDENDPAADQCGSPLKVDRDRVSWAGMRVWSVPKDPSSTPQAHNAGLDSPQGPLIHTQDRHVESTQRKSQARLDFRGPDARSGVRTRRQLWKPNSPPISRRPTA